MSSARRVTQTVEDSQKPCRTNLAHLEMARILELLAGDLYILRTLKPVYVEFDDIKALVYFLMIQTVLPNLYEHTAA